MPAGPSRRRLRVVTWNIRAAIGPGEPFPPAWWRHVRSDRMERIAATLRDLDPDVATLQEVAVLTPHGELIDQPAELARLTNRHVRYAAVHAYRLVEPESGRAIGFASWGNAILSREPLRDGFAFGLPGAADHELIEDEGALHPFTGLPHPAAGRRYRGEEPGHREPRCVVGGTIASITVATTHLTYVGRMQRRSQATAIAAALADRPGPTVVTGDFNAAIDAPELDPLDDFDDAFASVGVPPSDRRRASNLVHWPIDHVRVHGLVVESCRVATEAGDASDHWPVVADVVAVGEASSS